MLGTIEMRAKAHTFVGDLAKRGQTKDLIAAGIGEDGARPGHELMQAAEAANQIVTGSQVKMISVGEEDFRAEFFQGFLGERFHAGLRTYRQKERSLHDAVGRGQQATSRTGGIGLPNLEGKIHLLSVSGEDEGPSYTAKDVNGPNRESDCE